MKKSLFTLVFALVAATTTAFGQAAKAPDSKTEAQLIALEKAGWEAWKTKDAAWLKANIAEDFMLVGHSKNYTKDQYITTLVTGCQVERYSLDSFTVRLLDENVAQLTYAASQLAVCDGKPSDPKVRAIVTYVRRGGKWLWFSYMETPDKA